MSREQIKVLLVEDNVGDARLLRELLKEPKGSPFELVHVGRLSEALSSLRVEPFGVILLDLSLPDAQGLDTICRLRSHAANVPIVIMTGLDDEEFAVTAVEQGAQDYLIKGQVDGHLLARALRYAIQRHKAEESLKERNRELLTLRKISETILGSLDLKSVLETILEQAMESGSFDLGNIRMLDRSGKALEVMATRGYRDPTNILRHRRLSRAMESEQSHFGDRIFKESCIEEHLQQSSRFRTLRKEGIESFIDVPIRANGEVVGMIQLASRAPREFRPEEVDLLETIGNQMGVAVQKAQLYEETRRQAVELEKANKMQGDFTAMIGHDLRSPMQNIIGAAGMMEDGVFGMVNEEQRKWLRKILATSHGLLDLVNDFLDLSKIETGNIDLVKEEVDLERLLQATLECYLPLAQEKQISLHDQTAPCLPKVYADPRRLEQVLTNLLSNAIKFTGEGGRVEVGAQTVDGTGVKVYVKDTGVGIPKDEIDTLFKKYRQTTSGKTSGQRGTGLGLAICKMIVEAHSGTIAVESEVGQGTTFFFSLPLAGPTSVN